MLFNEFLSFIYKEWKFVRETKGNITDSEQIGFTVVLPPRTVWAVTWTVRFAGVIEREYIQRGLEIFTRQKKLQKDWSKSHMLMISELLG